MSVDSIDAAGQSRPAARAPRGRRIRRQAIPRSKAQEANWTSAVPRVLEEELEIAEVTRDEMGRDRDFAQLLSDLVGRRRGRHHVVDRRARLEGAEVGAEVVLT